jgi:hypothetical protein
VAVDGKALCGARTVAGRVFLVAAISHGSGVVPGKRQVPDKRGEATVVHDLLAPLDVAGTVLTLDALHSTKRTARMITGQLHAHYLLILKGNQPLAARAAQALLAGTDTEFAQHTAIDENRGHARTERRTLRTAPADDTVFPGARQVFRLRRDVGGLDGVRTGKEIVFGMTSLPVPGVLLRTAFRPTCIPLSRGQANSRAAAANTGRYGVRHAVSCRGRHPARAAARPRYRRDGPARGPLGGRGSRHRRRSRRRTPGERARDCHGPYRPRLSPAA